MFLPSFAQGDKPVYPYAQFDYSRADSYETAIKIGDSLFSAYQAVPFSVTDDLHVVFDGSIIIIDFYILAARYSDQTNYPTEQIDFIYKTYNPEDIDATRLRTADIFFANGEYDKAIAIYEFLLGRVGQNIPELNKKISEAKKLKKKNK